MNTPEQQREFAGRNPHFGFREVNAILAENGSEFDHANVVVLKAELAAWRAEDRPAAGMQ